MEMRPEDMDWAIVDRLREMLVAPPKTDYEISLSYGLFGAILCWTMQHFRINRAGHANLRDLDTKVIDIACALKKVSASELPWRCSLTVRNEPRASSVTKELSMYPEEFKLSAFGLLKMMRDAIAHGDQRKVSPKNRPDALGNMVLYGFDLKLEWDKHKDFGTVQLLHGDIVRIGRRLAEMYCTVLKETVGDPQLEQRATKILEERASKEAA